MSEAQKSKVYLVGAGPGDPELLTVRAATLLQTADAIYHDDLVPRQVLDLARPGADVSSVGKRYGTEHITQSDINRKLIASAQAGLSVVRLKSGDPMIFGRAGEEISALVAAGIPFEVVPGVTAALAAAAALGCSLTHRSSASSVLFMTGHRAKDPIAVLPPTRVIYMPGSDLSAYAKEWIESGDSPAMPCVLLSRVAQPGQSILRTTVAELPNTKAPGSPAILLAGWALEDFKRP